MMSSYRDFGRKPPDSLGLLAFRSVECATTRLAAAESVFYTDLVLAAITDTPRVEMARMKMQRN